MNKDGGPEFPRTQWTGSDKNAAHRDVPGMTLRDWFSGQVVVDDDYSKETKERLLGREQPPLGERGPGEYYITLERIRFDADFRALLRGIEADAMIAERSKEHE